MKPPGRNAPCHCGSGIKYKTCCLEKDQARTRKPTQTYLLDSTSQRLLELAKEDSTHSFLRDHRRIASDLNSRFLARVLDGLGGREAAEALEHHINDLELAIADIAKRRSRLYWQHLSRRIPPVQLEGSSPWTVVLYRAVFQLAILKHGLDPSESDDMVFREHSLVPHEITYEDYRDIYALEYLSLELNHAVTSYRRVGKGAVIRVRRPTTYIAFADKDAERLMRLLDKRRMRYHELFSSFGSSLKASFAGVEEAEKQFGLLRYPALNADQRTFSPELSEAFGLTLADSGRTNYLPAVIAVQPVLDLLRLYDDQLRELCGVSAEQIIGVLWAIGTQQMVAILGTPAAGMQYLQRAYAVYTKGEGIEAAVEHLAGLYRLFAKDRGDESLDHEGARATVEQVISALTWRSEDFSEISLWDKSPHKLIFNYGDVHLWDHSATAFFLQSLIARVAFLSGEVGNVKSANFEAEVIELIDRTDGVDAWQSQKELVAADGAKRQIDASFIKGDTLYVIECKAFSAHPRIDRGDFAALKTRWETLSRYLDQARTLVTFLAANPVGRNYSVPDGVHRIEPCLCTPLPEAIPNANSDLWFDEETPRISVPAELLEYAIGNKPRLLDPSG